MSHTFIKKILLTLSLALAITSNDLLIYEYVCQFPEHGPSFYGFPFVKSTNTSWVFSMSGDLYVLGFIGNVLFWGVLLYIPIHLMGLIKIKRVRNIFMVLGWILFSLGCISTSLGLTVIDWRLEWHHDNFRMNYYQTDIECEKKFHWVK
ncbi:MAG: hypothetical protein AAFP76_08355 [Bacteroidota bacterium]